jgi:4-hydroxy-tetrahydrodipicolinate synthase
MEKLSGIIPPMVTPLTANHALDKDGVAKMVEHLVGGGVDGIFLLGTTGEGPHLPYALRRELVAETCRCVAGRVPVFVGITETDMDDALAFACDCHAFGASYAVAAPPYYFKLSQGECVAWYMELANRLEMPLVIYNMPSHTDTTLAPATLAQLAAHPNIVGLKDSSGSISYFNKVRVAVEPFAGKFAMFMGPDAAVGEAVLMGADGGVCTGANLWPRVFKSLHLAAKAGDLEKVRKLQRFTTDANMRLYAIGSGHSSIVKGVKAALAEMGLIQNVLATPFTPFDGKELETVKEAVRTLREQIL